MKKILTIASMILLFAVSALGFAFAEDQAAANDSINASQINGTVNATLNNATLGNGTLLNETIGNATASENDSNPFADAKNRKPSVR
ncbi:MAG: hypothetical protein A4E49_03321 [Methanosaeta sp. PtaU1.Bin112]|nr:MAG: hypothetical protein A4E49_03321 [Methanosaeta sp. PtaU1.Bin112]